MLAEKMIFSSRFEENEIISFQGEETFQLEVDNIRTNMCLLVISMVRLFQETVYLTKLLFFQTERGCFLSA